MKKLLASDCLRAVQFKYNTSANYTSQLWIMLGWKKMGHFVSQWNHVKRRQKILLGTFEKSFFECEKIASRKILEELPLREFFPFLLVISNHKVFLIQFEINSHLRVFQKAEIIALAEAARVISAFWKTHSCKSIPNWTRNRMITYTDWTVCHACNWTVRAILRA